MKVIPNTKVRDAIMQQKVIDDVNISGAVAKLKAAMGELDGIFVERSEEIEMITLAIACGQHVLFEGKHGVAKSDLSREAFRRITGAQVYDKMFSKGVSPDDVFGPTLMDEYRKGNWVHNTKGRLPTAHFANLEELGRASDLLLPSTMTILNERLFHNGHLVEKSPLITAIATTNFLTENDELAAFNDRWLIRAVVQPLKTNQKIVAMMNLTLTERRQPRETISLTEILAINKAASTLRVESETIPLYVDLVQSYKKEAKIAYISDRRISSAFKLARAAALLSGADSVQPEHLGPVRYGVSVAGRDDEQQFSGVFSRIIGEAAAHRAENKEINKVEIFLKMQRKAYDPSLPTKELKAILDHCDLAYNGLKNRNIPIKIPENQARYNAAAEQADELRNEIRSVLSKRI